MDLKGKRARSGGNLCEIQASVQSPAASFTPSPPARKPWPQVPGVFLFCLGHQFFLANLGFGSFWGWG